MCDVTAAEVGVDPLRLLPHSLRSGALAQIELLDDLTEQHQGGWLSVSGMMVYASKCLANAREVAHAIHDTLVCPLTFTRMMF